MLPHLSLNNFTLEGFCLYMGRFKQINPFTKIRVTYSNYKHVGVCNLMMVYFDTLDAIHNLENMDTSTYMDILRHLHNDSCNE